MAFAVEAFSKNTFIEISTDVPIKQAPRSRSAESARCRPEAEELDELTQQSLQRLTSAMNNGTLEPLPRAWSPANSQRTQASPRSSLPRTILQKSFHMNSPQKHGDPWDQCLRVESNCSLSTMAGDDASDAGETVPKGIRAVWSSGSLSSMVSDVWGSIAEDDKDMGFELDIEAGAAAAAAHGCHRLSPIPDFVEAQVELPALEPEPPLNHGRITAEMSHGLVPKNQNMEEMYQSTKNAPPTTLMIRNIPGKYTQNDLMLDLKATGFGSAYDFLYLPIDKGTAANVGYAFVNFTEATMAAKCIKSFEGHRFSRHQRSSNKLARISVAHLQGLEKNLQHYENAAVNASKEKRRRPVIIANISSMFD